MTYPTRENAIAYLKKLAHHLKSYSDDGQYKHIRGPSSGRAWEFGEEIEMALKAIDPPAPPLPTIEPHLLEVKQ